MHQLEPSFSEITSTGRSGCGVVSIAAVSILVALLGAGVFGLMALDGSDLPFLDNPAAAQVADNLPFVLGGLLCLGFGSVAAWAVGSTIIGGAMRRAKLDEPEVLGPEKVRVGESFRVQYRQAVKGDINVTRINVRLLLREWVRYTSGTDTYTTSHDHVIQTHELPGGLFSSGSMIIQELDFAIPPSGIHTFPTPQMIEDFKDSPEVKQMLERNPRLAVRITQATTFTPARNNKLSWHVHVQIDIDRWPDYNQAFEVPVAAEVLTDNRF
ncbi:MAG: hypothetical protein GYB64_04055 [Chloroflexi bacterium]|nr:hypothetical protein [Chloroflexota bacterium]